jgi:hypothetical protein
MLEPSRSRTRRETARPRADTCVRTPNGGPDERSEERRGPPHGSRQATSVNLLRAGWPWRLPARAPTDPDVRALTHPVLRPTGWPSSNGPRDYPSELRGQAPEPRCAPPVSLAWVCRPTLRFPPQGPPGRVPLLQRYYQSATTSCRPSRRTSLPSLGGTSASTRSFRSPADECAAEAWSWSPGTPAGILAEETTGSPRFPRNPDCPFAMFSRRRQDCSHQTGTVQQRGPWYVKSRGSHERSFDAP